MRALAALIVAAFAELAVAAPQLNNPQPAWVETIVFPRAAKTPVAPADGREPTDRDVMFPAPTIVLDVDEDRLLVLYGGADFHAKGWVKKSDVIPLGAAEAFFTEMIKRRPEDPWGYLGRPRSGWS